MNKYILTIAAGKRVREIVNGVTVLVKTSKKDTCKEKYLKK